MVNSGFGNPNYVVPTPAFADSSNRVATTAFVQQVASGGPPSVLFNTRTAAAAATIPSNISFVETAGYATVGDGGDALYIHASGSTYGGFQSADGQWWQLAPWTIPNIIQFGADNTATVGSDAAIAAAFNFTQAVNVGHGGLGVVYFPAGVYKVFNTVVIPNACKMQGNGKRSTTIFADSTFPINTAVVQMGSGGGPFFDLQILDIGID